MTMAITGSGIGSVPYPYPYPSSPFIHDGFRPTGQH